MGNYESESDPEKEWDDSWEDTGWTEFNWEQYLRCESEEVKKYQAIYTKLIRSHNRLDEVALYMGWQPNGEPMADAEGSQGTSAQEEPPPYTLHRHPLYVSSKALHSWLSDQWSRRVSLSSSKVDAAQAVAFQSAINESDQYGVLAVTALDMDDFALAIAYFKRGLAAVNRAFGIISSFEAKGVDSLSLYVKHARIRLFDIREIWLRVTSDCRATLSRRSNED